MKSFSVVLSHYKGSDMPTSCEVGRHWCVGVWDGAVWVQIPFLMPPIGLAV